MLLTSVSLATSVRSFSRNQAPYWIHHPFMVTETLHYESAHQAQLLFANDDRNLKHLENELGVRAVSRDGWIKLEGEAEKGPLGQRAFPNTREGPQGWQPDSGQRIQSISGSH